MTEAHSRRVKILRMALDTAIKRASAAGFALVAVTFVIPSGGVTAGDRQTISDMYSGILASQPVAGVPCNFDQTTILNKNIDNITLLGDQLGDTILLADFFDSTTEICRI